MNGLRRLISLFTVFRSSEKGFILMTSYMLISVVSIGALAVYFRGNTFMQATERNQNKIVAFNMAEAAVDLAISQLNADPSYAGSGGYTSLSTDSVEGGYEVSVTIPVGAPNTRLIQAVGHAPSNTTTDRAYETRTVNAYVEFGEMNLFDFAVFAEQSIQLNGNPLIDSYDSRNGPYGAGNINANGDMGTDSTGDGTVSLSGNVVVNGDAVVGPDSDPDSVISTTGDSVINGTTSSSSSTRDYEAEVTNAASLGDLSINGNNTVQLQGGEYRYDSLSISGNGTLEPLGPVTIYVDGSVSISGNGVATQGNLPPNFLLFVSGSDTVQFSGNADFFGGVFAPNAPVRNVGNGSIYGAVVAQTYQQSGNGDLHYDEAMNEVGESGSSGISMKSWQEENTSAWGM